MKKILFFSLCITLLFIASTLAETDNFGVLRFKNLENQVTLMADVQDLTQNEARETPLVRYQLHDALLDGNRIAFTIYCEPKEPDKYMLIPSLDPSETDMMTGKSYEQIAKESGKINVYTLFDVSINDENASTRRHQILQDGKLYCLFESGVSLMEGNNVVVCKIKDNTIYGIEFVKEDDDSLGVEGYSIPDIGKENEVTIQFSIKGKPFIGENTVRLQGPLETEFATIDWVEYSVGNLNATLRIQYTIHENLSVADLDAIKLMTFRLMKSPEDEYGVGMSGSTTRLDGKENMVNIEGVTCIQERMFDATDAPSDVIYLRPRYAGGKYGELVTLLIP